MRTRYTPFRVAVFVGLVTAATSLLRAQEVFRSGVDLVYVTVTVADDKGRFISGLHREDFTVLDDGKPQEIVSFDARRVPVSLGILLDVSGSMSPEKLAAARAAINRFSYDLLDKDDELFLTTFAARSTLRQPWTKDRDTLGRALDRARSAAGTSIYDAVRSALPVAATGLHDKKALLIVSDGDDQNSRTPLKLLQEIIRSSEVLVYALGVEASDEHINAKNLRKITDGTGGRTEIVKGFLNLQSATAKLAEELNQQYLIAYAMPHAKDGASHSIKVQVRKRGVTVRSRSGYLAGTAPTGS